MLALGLVGLAVAPLAARVRGLYLAILTAFGTDLVARAILSGSTPERWVSAVGA